VLWGFHRWDRGLWGLISYDFTTHCNTLQHTATHCTTLQRTATHCNMLQHTATLCNTLQHTATHCNTLQHTETLAMFKTILCRCMRTLLWCSYITTCLVPSLSLFLSLSCFLWC